MKSITSIEEWANKYVQLRMHVGAQIELMETMEECIGIASRRLKEIHEDISKTVEVMREVL